MLLKIITFFLALAVGSISNAQIKSATLLIEEAKAAATKNNQKIFVKFTASWCTWCHKMQAALTDSTVAPIFNKYYVLTSIVVQENGMKKKLENKGGEKILKDWGGAEKGLPYWVVLDANASFLANSNNKKENIPLRADGDNVGCPAEDDEIAYFIRVIRKTSNITTAELAVITKRFKKIKTNSP